MTAGGAGMSVNIAELSAGVDKVAALFGDCETTTAKVTETLTGMVSAAGHPGLINALTTFTESNTKALLSTGKVLTYVGAGLHETATTYSRIEADNTRRLNAVLPNKAS